MSTVTGNSAAYHASVDVPDDFDERDAAAILVVAEAAMDNTAFLYTRVVGGSGVIITEDINASGNVDIAGSAHVGGNLTVDGLVTAANVNTDTLQADVLVDAQNISSDTNVTAGTGFFVPERTVTVWIDAPADAEDGWICEREALAPNEFHWVTTTTNIRDLRVALNAHIPRNANITQVKARFKGAPGHAALPSIMPELTLYRKRTDPAGAASASIGNEFDSSADAAAFEAEHDITLTVGSGGHTADTSTAVYYAIVSSESDGGSNAIAGAKLAAIGITYTYTRVDRT